MKSGGKVRQVAAFLALLLCLTVWGFILDAEEGLSAPIGFSTEVAKVEIPPQPLSEVELRGPAEVVSVEVRNVPFRELVDFLVNQTQKNIVVSSGVEGNVTLRMPRAPWLAVLEAAADQIDCVVEEEEGIYTVSKPPRVTITFTEAPLKKAISTVAKLAGANIIISQDVTGVISARLEDVPWKEALKKIVETGGFVLVKEKYGVYRVVTAEALKTQLVTRVLYLKYVQPPDAYIAKIETRYAVGGPQQAQAPTTLAVYGGGGGVGGSQTAQGAGGILTQFPLLDALRRVLSPQGSIQYDRFSNSFIVQDIKPKVDEIADVIARVDVAPMQVGIDVKFVTTGNEDLLDFGIDYGELGAQVSATGATMSHELPFDLRRKDLATGAGLLSFGTIAPILTLLKRDATTKLHQAPKEVTLDNHTATIFVGDTIRFAETFAATNQAGGVQAGIREAANSPVETGFQLLITPHIIRGTDQVILQVLAQDQSLSGPKGGFDEYTSGVETIRLPRIRSRTVVTKLLMKTGQTAVLGGLMAESATETVSKWPFLGDIPIAGWIFKSQRKDKVRNNLLIFITVIIFHSEAEIAQYYRIHEPTEWTLDLPADTKEMSEVWKNIDKSEVTVGGAPSPVTQPGALVTEEAPSTIEALPPTEKEVPKLEEKVSAPEALILPEEPVVPREEVPAVEEPSLEPPAEEVAPTEVAPEVQEEVKPIEPTIEEAPATAPEWIPYEGEGAK